MKKIKKIWVSMVTLFICLPVSVLAVEDYEYGSSEGGSFDLTIALAIIFIAVIFFMIFKEVLKAKNNVNLNSMDSDVDSTILAESGREHGEHIEVLDNNYDDVIGRHIPGYNEKKLLNELYKTFCLVERALISHDKNELKRVCSNELWNYYVHEGMDGIRDFKLTDSNIRNIEENNGVVVIDMYLCVSLEERQEKYDLEFVLDKKSRGICSHCGAPLKGDVCEYCYSKVEKNGYHFVLNKKNNISD